MTKKKVLIIALALGLIIVGVAFVLIWPVRDNWRQQYLYHKILGEFSDLENAYKNDSYGGSTPEETLKLFIEALQKGDIDLASKYFVPEKQTYNRNNLVKILEDKKETERIVKELDYNSKNINLKMGFAVFSRYSDIDKAWIETRFRLNEYTNKWLIESL